MSDNLNRKIPEDPTKINVHEKWEIDYWTKALGVTEAKLRAAVSAVGPLVKNVKNRLGI